MALMGSGKQYAEEFMLMYNIEAKGKDGNTDKESTDKITESMAKTYDLLFEYICTKLTTADILIPSAVVGTHMSGPFAGVTKDKVNIKLS